MALYPRIPIISVMRNDIYISENTFFDAFYYPDASTRNEFLNYFLLEYGGFTPIYQYPQFLLDHIKAVSASLKYTIDKLYATLSLEYNPIENYDRREKWTDSGTNSRSASGENSETLTMAGGETTTYNGGETKTYTGGETKTYSGGETTTYSGGQSTVKSGGHTEARQQHATEHQVSADNTGAYFPSEKTIEDPDSTSTTYNSETDTQTFNARSDSQQYNNRSDSQQYNNRSDSQQYNNRSDSMQYNNRSDSKTGTSSDTEEGTSETEHEGRIHGNIGVTTSQQMIKSERDDVAYYNFIDDVARLYGEKLCILIY